LKNLFWEKNQLTVFRNQYVDFSIFQKSIQWMAKSIDWVFVVLNVLNQFAYIEAECVFEVQRNILTDHLWYPRRENYAQTMRTHSTLFFNKKSSRTWILELYFEWFSCMLGSEPELSICKDSISVLYSVLVHKRLCFHCSCLLSGLVTNYIGLWVVIVCLEFKLHRVCNLDLCSRVLHFLASVGCKSGVLLCAVGWLWLDWS